MMPAEVIRDSSGENPAPGEPAAARTPTRRAAGKSNEVLGVAWLHGTLQAELFRRNVAAGSWVSSVPVRTMEEFEVGLDAALTELAFSGTDVFLILEHDQFVHQAEHAPAFSEAAAQAYLRGRVQRYEKEREPVIWISQRTIAVRQEASFLLHMLPAGFHARLSSLLVTRHLDLTRIIPLVVPLQLLLEETPAAREQTVLFAAAAGDATTLMVARGHGELLFSRTMMARWDSDPARVAVEVNRSLLYAKQQFGAAVDRIELVGTVSDQVRAEVQTRCGVEKQINVRPADIRGWLNAVAHLSARHPVNLMVASLARKRRRQSLRRALLATCWLALAITVVNAWSQSIAWQDEQQRLVFLQASAPELRMEQEQLQRRQAELLHHQALIRQAADERLPPVAPRFLAYLGSIRGPDTQFSDFVTKWDPETTKWTFRLEGRTEGDDETVREMMVVLQRTLETGAWRIRCDDTARVLVRLPAVSADVIPVHRFVIEGGLFEN